MSSMKVACTGAALGYERLEGSTGTLESPPLPLLGYRYISGPNEVTIYDLTHWGFEPREGAALNDVEPIIEAAREVPARRARDVYDQDSFAADLDLAINYVRSTVLDIVRDPKNAPQPTLTEGVTMANAMYGVCVALMLRQLGIDFEKHLDRVLSNARELLIAKNKAYGDSALNPVRIFSKASLKEQLLVRLDDKVSRLARGSAAGEDVAGDMLGYLLLVTIAEKREREASDPGTGIGVRAEPIAAHWRTEKS